MTRRICLSVFALLVSSPVLLRAQATPLPHSPEAVTAEDYARAERHLGSNLSSLVYGGSVRPSWIDGNRFWYRNTVQGGAEYVLVDPEQGTRERAFDHERLSETLVAMGEPAAPLDLTLSELALEDGGGTLGFRIRDLRFSCSLESYACESGPAEDGLGRAFSVSPDGARAVFRRDHNLWVRDLTTGAERALTRDGVEDYGYATDNAGWTKSERPVVLWSPDSRKVTTFQHDARGVGMMYLVSTGVGHPEMEAWKYPLPEDSVIFRIERVVIDVVTGDMVRLNMEADQHRSTICDHIVCGGAYSDIQWSADSRELAFVSSSRDHKVAQLRVADVATGEVRDVLREEVKTFFESGHRMVNWSVSFASDEVLWYSQRSNWGHMYLYDLTSGELKAPVTSGDWNVLQVRKVDLEDREIFFTGAGREPGDPYFEYFYSVGLDGGEERLLTPERAHHTVSLSPDGEYFVDSWSTPTTPPVTVVRNLDGQVVVELETADITDLIAAGWKPPRPFTVIARDGKTELHGLLYRPTDFDETKKYPVVNYLYPGPQSGSVGSRSFSAARRDHQAIAELGFIVVEVDAMGTPMRSKSFHEAYYGNMGDNGLPDQVGGIQQLGERYPWMDLDRVGIWGHSGGGFASTAGILSYPDFYKVAVSQAGNHDNRNYEDDWGEKWQGLLEINPDGTTTYDNQANQLKVKNLKGKLLLAHGTMDSNVPPSNTMLMVDALIEANKDFDLVLFPNRRHGFGFEPYMMRRRWDYFVKNLLGSEPPAEFEFGQQRRPVS